MWQCFNGVKYRELFLLGVHTFDTPCNWRENVQTELVYLSNFEVLKITQFVRVMLRYFRNVSLFCNVEQVDQR